MAEPAAFKMDTKALVAAVDLVGRSGATAYEVGYLDDSADYRDARWWASCQYRGAKVAVEGYPSPVAASEALARRLLTGGQCMHCGHRIVLGASKRAARRAKRCVWARNGDRWVRGCKDQVPEGQRAIPRQPWQSGR